LDGIVQMVEKLVAKNDTSNTNGNSRRIETQDLVELCSQTKILRT